MEIKVGDVMVADASFTHPDSNLAEVAAILWEHGCGALPVVDGARKVVGMITDRDIGIALGTRNLRPSDVTVASVAPARYFACGPAEDIRSALETMAAQAVRRLPVVDKAGKLVGALSIDDIILNAETVGIKSSAVLNTLRAICGYRTRAHGTIVAATLKTMAAFSSQLG